MSAVYVLAGPNGAGKTTLQDWLKVSGLLPAHIPFINVDNIARFELKSYAEPAMAEAQRLAQERMGAALAADQDFLVESNLAASRDYEWVERLRRSGRVVKLFFVSTENVSENIARIERRVREGGHSVPPHIVEDRYRMIEVLLKGRLHLFEEAMLIDNSGPTVRVVARLNGQHIAWQDDTLPQWAERVLFIAKRLSQKGE